MITITQLNTDRKLPRLQNQLAKLTTAFTRTGKTAVVQQPERQSYEC